MRNGVGTESKEAARQAAIKGHVIRNSRVDS